MVKDIIIYAWSLIIAMGATVPSRINYGGDGTPGSVRQAWLDLYAGEQTITAGSEIAQSGVGDFLHSGRPFIQIEVIPQGTGNRAIEVLVQYFNKEAESLVQSGADRFFSEQYFSYIPSPLLWRLPVKRDKGNFVRVRSIINRGDSTFIAKVLCPASVAPVDDTVEIIERDVIENATY